MKLNEEELGFGWDDEGSIAYENTLEEYDHSVFEEFENFLKTEQTDEEDKNFTFNLNKSRCIEYEMEPLN